MSKAIVPAALITVFFFLCASPACALCVKATEANLRAGPGTNYEKTWEVYKYMPLRKITRKGGWYRVSDLEGDEHWIYGGLVTGKYKCAVVKEEKANIRSGPGTKYRKLIFSPVLKYYTFKVVKISGKWVKVKDDYEDTGWIHRKLLWIQ
jgi:SH3-like domain-containing protein